MDQGRSGGCLKIKHTLLFHDCPFCFFAIVPWHVFHKAEVDKIHSYMIVHFVTMHMFFPWKWWHMFGRKRCFTLMIRMLFHLFSAWQGTAGQEDSKRQVTAGTKLYGLLKSWATPVGPYPRIGWVCQTRLLGSSLCSACYEPTPGCQSCRWWGMVQIQFIYVLLLWFWLVTYRQP
jgi:hypothetical protein